MSVIGVMHKWNVHKRTRRWEESLLKWVRNEIIAHEYMSFTITSALSTCWNHKTNTLHEIHEIFTAASFSNRGNGEELDSVQNRLWKLYEKIGSFVSSEDMRYQSETVVVWTFTNAPGQSDDFLLYFSYVLCFYETVLFSVFAVFYSQLVIKQKPFTHSISLYFPTHSKLFIFKRPQIQFVFMIFMLFSPFYFIFIAAFVISYFMIHLTAKQKQQSIRKASSLKLLILSQVCLYLLLAEKEKKKSRAWKHEKSSLFYIHFIMFSSFLCFFVERKISYWKIYVRWLINQNSSLYLLSLFDVQCTV